MKMNQSNQNVTRPLLPTITSAVGMLMGGLLGLAFGSFLGGEFAVMVSFILGAICGSATGAIFGKRWLLHRNRNPDHSQ